MIFRPMTSTLRTLGASCLLGLAAVPIAAHDANGQSIRGRVVDAESGAGITQVAVIAAEGNTLLETALSNEEGEFEIRLNRAGTVTLRATRQGYRARAIESIVVSAGESVVLPDLPLERAPIILEEVRAEAPQGRLTPGREWIRRRQLLGKGTFLSGSMLMELQPPSLTRFVADETNLWVEYDIRGVPRLKNPFAMNSCMAVYLNQWPLNREAGQGRFREVLGWPSMDEIPLENIAAVEIYNDLRDLPPGLLFAYGGRPQSCGVINIWTWDAY